MLKSKRLPKIAKYLTFVYIAVFLVSTIGSMQASARNGNISDTLYIFENTYENIQITETITPFREKWDYTSSYAYNSGSNTDITRVKVRGKNLFDDYFVDCTYGSWKDLPIGYAYYFPNTVKESGYSHAALEFWPAWGTYGMYIHVYWSPDSI